MLFLETNNQETLSYLLPRKLKQQRSKSFLFLVFKKEGLSSFGFIT
jgi:hypothetical protein